jgi:hypothetical protein
MTKAHCIKEVPEIPLVVEGKIEGYKKTKEVVLLLKKLKAWNDIKKVYASQQMKAGKGEMRNHHCIQRRNPASSTMKTMAHQGLQKYPGITPLNVNKLNTLKFAPGGHGVVFAFGLKVLSGNWMTCMALGVKVLPSRITTTFPAQGDQYGPRDPKSP